MATKPKHSSKKVAKKPAKTGKHKTIKKKASSTKKKSTNFNTKKKTLKKKVSSSTKKKSVNKRQTSSSTKKKSVKKTKSKSLSEKFAQRKVKGKKGSSLRHSTKIIVPPVKPGFQSENAREEELHPGQNLFTKKDVSKGKLIEEYHIKTEEIPIVIKIFKKKGEFVLLYHVQLASIGEMTGMVLEKIRQELIKRVNLGILDITDPKKENFIEDKFSEATLKLIEKYFPGINEDSAEFLTSYLVKKSLGMGDIELLMEDPNLEEITINSADEPIWVYHKHHGWLKTNILVSDEAQSRHFASMIGRKVNRQITILNPLMDATLGTGDRVNATLMPVSTKGNTLTIRKFAAKPWTITDFIRTNSISAAAAAIVWECVHYEMSIIIAGGTASGKTSMLNVVANFFPPNQRIISIEDTREIQLPSFLHWVPMLTRLPNNEGKGEIKMLDLLVNSLRMRPDRIVVGEIRRKEEARVLFESIHTGHSVYATVHANNTKETITRLVNPPIEIPKSMLSAVSLVLVQYRNRRSGLRRTFELSEIKENGDPNVLMRYDVKKDLLKKLATSIAIKRNLKLYTGATDVSIKQELKEKELVLKWLVKQKITSVENVGKVMAEYYTNKENLMKYVKANKSLPS